MFVQYRSAMSVRLEHRDLRSAIEFAVLVAEEANKGKRVLPHPSELKAHFGAARIPTAALGTLRRAIEADDTFRERLAAGAVPELVDPIGLLWLQRPSGWEEQVQALLAERAEAERDADLAVALKRADKRRRAAEQVAARSRADIIERDVRIAALEAQLDEVRADLVKADDAVAELRAELIDVRNEARHARDREAALRAKLEAVESLPAAAPEESVDDQVVAAAAPSVDVDEIDEIARSVRELAARLDQAIRPPDSGGAGPASSPGATRRPLRLPGGVIASSGAAAEFLLRSDAAVLVDGYNVAKLGWPNERLDDQRRRLLDGLENAARRFGADITVVFDGASVVGAHADRRRMVRVTYSPDGVTADDVIRDEVRRLPVSRSVAVVTNDAEIVADVRAHGANVVPSNALLAVL
jgi:predicted RNA-binding protein with PIN domain